MRAGGKCSGRRTGVNDPADEPSAGPRINPELTALDDFALADVDEPADHHGIDGVVVGRDPHVIIRWQPAPDRPTN
jgi:hypothetical protein